ncbi:MAG: carboxylesterase/lipase family protein [Steroidobacteraceae bacterium]
MPTKTESGMVDGVRNDGLFVYRGIPFAAPPLDELRWRSPQPAVIWSGTRKADRFSPVCMQTGSYPPDTPAEPTSEDCLYLNIWTPVEGSTESLPVMVWIYGGGLANGSASTPLYAGDRLARKGVVVVTFNYRIGALGFLAHPDLSREAAQHTSGNYGLLDQIAALRWVQRNIAAFGGDPHRVTVFGQSSGSISISALITSPLARGLFQRAIGQSGGLFEPLDLAPDFKLAGAEETGRQFVARSGAASLTALRHRAAAEVLKTPFNPHAIIDGYVLKESPYDAYRQHQHNRVPLLIGSNADEGQFFIAGHTITVRNFAEELNSTFPSFLSFLVRLIGPKPGATDADARASAAAFHGDLRFRWDMWAWAHLAAEDERNPVFYYEFNRAPPYRGDSKYAGMGATHGAEMVYVFDHLDQQSVPWTTKDRVLAATMSTYWTNFAKSGDPNGAGLPPWPRFSASGDKLMSLGEKIEPESIHNEGNLTRIDRVYATVGFVLRNARVLLTICALALLGLLTAIVRKVIRIRSRHASPPAAA